ncbi:MBL fold metallo-hydrolase [Actinomadura kijaniata]|uniref:MBL fold metallo-hydrolase n=1 Tax=Actinomadura kijaniata TaxID=46161 RepID=UPI000835A8E7|nr:MBL fold metallo-hydrolase [Actinomadura kijaniata]
MHQETLVVNGIEVIALCDAVGPMGAALRRPLPETFPGAADGLWERVREREPGAFGAGGEWRLHFHCFLLRGTDGALTLVDAGIGGADSPAALWAPVPGRLVAALAEAGVAAGEVGTVVLTHLHSDHASGAVAGGAPVFPNARHVVQARELAAVDRVMDERVVEPLRDLLRVVEGTVRLGAGVEVVPTPGHTPGHQSVAVGDVLVSGDVVLHPVQLADPRVRYVYDDDPGQAVETRVAVLEGLRARGGVLAAPHLPSPFVRVE